MRAEDLFGANASNDGGALGEAVDWLRDALSSGPRPSGELKKRADDDGISSRTLDRAKQKLSVTSQRAGFGEGGQWTWALPKHVGKDRQNEAQAQEVGAQ